MSEIFHSPLPTSSSHFSWPVFHGKRHLNTAGGLHVYLFGDIYAVKHTLKVFAYVPPVPCLSTLSERVERSRLQRHWGAIINCGARLAGDFQSARRWLFDLLQTPPMFPFSSFQTFDVQLFIIKAIYSFHAVFKVNIKSKLTLCTFLMHILGLIVNNWSVHILLKKNSFIIVYQNDFTKHFFLMF